MKATEREFFEGLTADTVHAIGAATLAKCEADDANADVIVSALDRLTTAVQELPDKISAVIDEAVWQLGDVIELSAEAHRLRMGEVAGAIRTSIEKRG